LPFYVVFFSSFIGLHSLSLVTDSRPGVSGYSKSVVVWGAGIFSIWNGVSLRISTKPTKTAPDASCRRCFAAMSVFLLSHFFLCHRLVHCETWHTNLDHLFSSEPARCSRYFPFSRFCSLCCFFNCYAAYLVCVLSKNMRIFQSS
jgi:hypothetical protein